MYIYICTYVLCMHVLSVYVCMYVYIYMCVGVIYVAMYVRIVHVCICIYVCVYIYVRRMEEGRGVHKVLVGKPEGKRPLGRPRHRWEDTIKMDLQEVGRGCGGLDGVGSG